MKNTMKLKSFGVALFFVFCWQGAVSAFEPSAPPAQEGQTGIPFEELYIMVSDIESGLEAFGGKLPYIRSKNQKVFSTLLNSWKQAQNQFGAIEREPATNLVNDTYNKIAYMQCDDIDKPESPVYKKLLFIRDKDSQSHDVVLKDLLSSKYCTNGRIAREAIDARVHAVYIRVYAAWVSAASFYYARNFAQTTYNFITTSLIPAITYVFSNGYDYVKKYGTQVLEKNKQRKQASAIRIKQMPAVEQAPALESKALLVESPQPSTISRTAPPQTIIKKREAKKREAKKREVFNPNA